MQGLGQRGQSSAPGGKEGGGSTPWGCCEFDHLPYCGCAGSSTCGTRYLPGAQGLEPAARADIWPLLLGVFAPASSSAEREHELERLRRLYTKLVLVCEELDRQMEALKGASASASASGSGPGSSPNKSPLPLPGNLAAFSEAHRIIVMDAVRTDIQRQAAGGPIGGGLPSPTLTILPVSVGDGLPELMMVSSPMPEPAPADAVAAGHVPLWRSALAADALAGAAHLNHHTRRQVCPVGWDRVAGGGRML